MGNSTSRVVGCFVPFGNGKDGVDLEFLEPLDEGLGHSFCYVRPVIADSPAITPSNSERFTVDSSTFDSETYSGSFRQEIVEESSGLQRLSKNFSETTFKTISGASVSANASTARTGNPNILLLGDAQEPAASFESTASFAAIPLQPAPRGSGPLNGFMSGPLERGFASGPLERGGGGFMSGPLEKETFMSGPLDSMDRSNFSAPLSYGQRRAGLGRLVRSVSRPMRSALTRTFTKRLSGPRWMQRFFLQPMSQFVWHPKDAKFRSEASRNCTDVGPSESEYSNTRNLQWAHGKAGEDRVHVVLSEEQGWLFVGIYDGFSGPDAPDFLMSNLYRAIDKELEGLLWDYEDKPGNSLPLSGILGSNDVGNSEECAKEEIIVLQSSSDGVEKNCDEGDVPVQLNEEESHGRFSAEKGLRVESVEADEVAHAKGEVEGIAKIQEASKTCQDCDGGPENEDLHIPATKFSVQGRKSMRLYEFLQMELMEDYDVKVSPSVSDVGSRKTGSWDLQPSASEDLYSRECLPEAQSVSCSASAKEDSSTCLGEDSNMRENEGIAREESKDSKHRVVPFSVPGHRQMMKRSLIGSKLRKMYRKQKSLRKKLFPWSYDWHREQTHVGERIIDSSVAIRRCKSGPVDHEAVLKAMSQALETTEEAYMEMVETALDRNPELALMGSCVLVMLMKDQDVYVMNLGDSRVILAQERLNDCYINPNLAKDDVRNRNRSRESLVRVELDRISEESPMQNPNSRLCKVNKNREISIYKLKMRAAQLSTDHSTSVEEVIDMSWWNLETHKQEPARLQGPCESLRTVIVKYDVCLASCSHQLHGVSNKAYCVRVENFSLSLTMEVVRIKSEHVDDVQAVFNDRVKGQLKVTRAFGAGFLKKPKFNEALLEMFRIDYVGNSPYVSCIPSVLHHRLCSNDRFLVLSSDGLYQYFSNEEVVSHVAWFMENVPEGDPAQYLIAELLFRAAKKNGMDFHELLDIPHGDRRKYHDDVSVMVISLEGRIWRSSG